MKKVAQVIRIYKILKEKPCVSVRRVQAATGLPRSSVYRCVRDMSAELPVRIQAGMIILENKPEPDKSMELV